jgi:hypothetical protein
MEGYGVDVVLGRRSLPAIPLYVQPGDIGDRVMPAAAWQRRHLRRESLMGRFRVPERAGQESLASRRA